jgi:hypothetical protein
MRVATIVLGIALTVTGTTTSRALDAGADPGAASTMLAFAPTERFITRNTGARLGTQSGEAGRGVRGAMGFIPSQEPMKLVRSRPADANAASESPRRRYNPASIPLPPLRTFEDQLLTAFVALMLIAYQLRRKHRFLRPHRFSV